MNYQSLLFSSIACDNGINNAPCSMQTIQNLYQLKEVLSAIEQLLGVNLIINSAFRCPELNTLVKGAQNSYHLYGLAADITIENSGRCTFRDLCDLCKELRKTRLQEVVVHDTYVHIAIKPYV